MGDAEALLLVDDEKSQILEGNVLREQAVGTDHNVHDPLLEVRDRLFDLAGRPEPAHKVHAHRIILHPLHKRVVVLLGQDRRGHKVSHLLAVLNGLEGRPDGDLRLPVADVPADEAVHDLPALHVPLRVLDRGELVLGLLVGKCLLKLLLPLRVRAVGVALAVLARRVEGDELPGDILRAGFDPGSGLLPLLAAQAIQLRGRAVARPRVFLQHVELGCEDVEVAALVLELDVVF